MPGADRLYPETDVRPVTIDKRYIEKLKKYLPKLLAHKEEDFRKEVQNNKRTGKRIVRK